MEVQILHTVYKITNLINNKIYIGIHITNNLNDDYFGSGKNIKNAIKKYGIENFKKEYLYIFDNIHEMYKMESILVNKDFIDDKNTYNISEGGNGGWQYVNTLPRIVRSREFYSKIGSWKDIEKRRKICKSVDSLKKYNNAKKMGLIFGGKNKLTNEIINDRLNLIKDIDMTKYGWVNKVSKILNITHAQTKRFIDNYYIGDFYRRTNK